MCHIRRLLFYTGFQFDVGWISRWPPGLPVTVSSGMAPAPLSPTVSWSPSAAFCHIKDVPCKTNLQQLWRQVLCSCRSETVEQPSS